MSTNIPKNYSMMSVVLVLALMFGGYYVFTNLWPNYQLAQAEYARIQAENVDLQDALKSVSAFLASYESQKQNQPKINLALPSHDVDMPNFLSSMQQIAFQSGVVLSNLQITNRDDIRTAADHSVQIQNISFGASGSYPTLKNFILNLETHLRLVDVDELSITSSTNSAGSPLLTYQVRLRTYFQQ